MSDEQTIIKFGEGGMLFLTPNDRVIGWSSYIQEEEDNEMILSVEIENSELGGTRKVVSQHSVYYSSSDEHRNEFIENYTNFLNKMNKKCPTIIKFGAGGMLFLTPNDRVINWSSSYILKDDQMSVSVRIKNIRTGKTRTVVNEYMFNSDADEKRDKFIFDYKNFLNKMNKKCPTIIKFGAGGMLFLTPNDRVINCLSSKKDGKRSISMEIQNNRSDKIRIVASEYPPITSRNEESNRNRFIECYKEFLRNSKGEDSEDDDYSEVNENEGMNDELYASLDQYKFSEEDNDSEDNDSEDDDYDEDIYASLDRALERDLEEDSDSD